MRTATAQVTFGADRKSFRSITNYDPIDDAGWLFFKVHNTDRVDAAIRGSCIANVSGKCDLPIGCNKYVDRKVARWKVRFDVRSSPTSKMDTLCAETLVATARRPSGVNATWLNAISHRNRIHELHVFTINCEDPDRVVGSMCDQSQLSVWADINA
jgi:hypothetical protein